LATDGLWSEVQVFGGASDAAAIGDLPEVIELLVIEHDGAPDHQSVTNIQQILFEFI